MQFFPHAEGYVKRNTNNTYLYVYQYKDHLGNIRLSYADVNANGTIQPASEILEENNYYPFGLKHKGYNEVVNSNRSEAAEKYKFLGKEFEGDLGFDVTAMDFRKYDGAIGRFFSMDAISEASVSLTPYHYGYNNPVFWSDPSGLLSDSFINSIWSSSGRGVTNWSNEGGYFRSNRSLDAFGNAFNVYNDGTVEESLSPIVIETTRSAFRGGNFNAYALGSFSLDKQIQHHVYTTANLYQGYRDGIREQQWNDFQGDMEYLGILDPTGIVDGMNSLIYLGRGQYANAAFSAAAILPLGDLAKGGKFLSNSSISSRILVNSKSQLQRKFKHAIDFGIEGTGTLKDLKAYSSALNQHINSSNINIIQGTYQSNPVIHYLNTSSGLNVMTKLDGTFISGWKLGEKQLENVVKRGSL